jgi:hypothetical protein
VRVITEVWAQVKAKLLQRAEAERKAADKGRDVNFKPKVGDLVLLVKQGKCEKLDALHDGPYRVIEVLDNGSRVRVRGLHRVMHDTFPLDHIKLYPYEDNDLNRGLENKAYEVQGIKDVRSRGDEVEYLVKFKGYPRPEWTHEDNLNAECQELVVAFHQRRKEDETFKARRQGHASEHPAVLAGTITSTARGVKRAFRSHREHHIRCAPEGSVPDPMDPIPEAALKYKYDQEKSAKKKKKNSPVAKAPAPASSSSSLQGATQDEPVPPAQTSEEYAAQSQVPLTTASAAAKVGRANRKPVNYKGLGAITDSTRGNDARAENKGSVAGSRGSNARAKKRRR